MYEIALFTFAVLDEAPKGEIPNDTLCNLAILLFCKTPPAMIKQQNAAVSLRKKLKVSS